MSDEAESLVESIEDPILKQRVNSILSESTNCSQKIMLVTSDRSIGYERARKDILEASSGILQTTWMNREGTMIKRLEDSGEDDVVMSTRLQFYFTRRLIVCITMYVK